MTPPKERAKRYGSEVPRIYTPPLRELTPETSKGFECIQFAEDVLGVTLLPWQKWLLIHALEVLDDGSYRFRTVILLVARQNGKSTLMQVLSLWRMYVDAAKLIIGTAQNLDIAEEQWQGAVELAEGVPELAEEISKVNKTNGKKALELESGERYKVAAANRKGGRGLSGDLVLMDELREHTNWDSWSAVSKTTLARFYAQVWAASNAGDAASIVLRFLRKLAHTALGNPDGLDDVGLIADPEGDDAEDGDSLGIFEWSARPGVSIWDRDGWAEANPSLGYTLTEKAIASAARTDPEGIFRTECLCQWLDTTADGPFPEGSWEAAKDPGSSIAGKYVFCVDVSWDRSTAHIGVAGFREDGLLHVEVVASRSGTAWVKPWFEERAKLDDLFGVTVQQNGAPASSLVSELETIDGLNVIPWAGSDLGRGTGMFYDRVRGLDESSDTPGDKPLIRHRGQPVLDVAASVAVTKPAGDAWLWDRGKSPVDISPLVAVTGAAWAFLVHGTVVKKRSKYEDEDLLTI